MSKITKFFDVYGMKCHSCEVTVENEIATINGVINVNADYKNSMIIVTYESETCNDSKIKNAIENAGFSYTNNMIIKVASLSILVISMFFLGNNPLIGSNPIETNNKLSFLILFILGLFTSYSCVSSCNRINFNQHLTKNKKVFFKDIFLYNTGRIISYTLVGGIIGAIGCIFQVKKEIQLFINVIVGIFMIILGLYITEIKFFKNLKLPTIFKKSSCVNNYKKPFVVGYLKVFSPCAPVQAMQLYALTRGSFIMGALSMLVFCLGTLPNTIISLFNFSKKYSTLNEKLFKYTGILIIVLGIFMMKFGFSII